MEPRNVRVLVVDDQGGIRQLLQEILRSEDYDVKLASNGYEALGVIEGFNPHIIVIDMKMPGMNGLEVIREIKSRDIGHGVFIMMTAYGELEIVNEAASLGVKYYINKPFDIGDLLNLIKKIHSPDGSEKLNIS
ncbi:MAG: response regulator [Clostridia bacterium]|nr:response regulator [Clostridia bacterium]